MSHLNPDFKSVRKEEAPKVIVFDLWRTLMLSVDKEPIKDLQGILGHNVQFAHGHWEPELDPDFLRFCLTTNCCDPERFLSMVARAFGRVAPPEAIDAFNAVLARESLNLARYEDVDDTIAGLKAKGFPLAILSNLWSFPERRIFVDNNFGRHFDHRIYSYEVGHRKPEPEMFLEVCKRFGVRPEDCLMVGDHPEADIQGALRVGMNAALIDRPGETHVQIPNVRVMRTLRELLELPSIR